MRIHPHVGHSCEIERVSSQEIVLSSSGLPLAMASSEGVVLGPKMARDHSSGHDCTASNIYHGGINAHIRKSSIYA